MKIEDTLSEMSYLCKEWVEVSLKIVNLCEKSEIPCKMCPLWDFTECALDKPVSQHFWEYKDV